VRKCINKASFVIAQGGPTSFKAEENILESKKYNALDFLTTF
jgi:hypothetical protein